MNIEGDFDASNISYFSQIPWFVAVTQKSWMPTPIESYLIFKVLIKIRIAQSKGLQLNPIQNDDQFNLTVV